MLRLACSHAAVPFLNVIEDCGAKGDGVADDTLAVQNCSDSLSQAGGVMYFPPGAFLISATIKVGPAAANYEIRGTGFLHRNGPFFSLFFFFFFFFLLLLLQAMDSFRLFSGLQMGISLCFRGHRVD